MKILEGINQGSQEWRAARAHRFTASQAPAMMGASKYQTRAELLREKATGITPEVTPDQQRLFDRGHAAEAGARAIAEQALGEDLYPVTAISETDDRFLASFDGITLGENIAFECKLWNESLAADVRRGEIGPHYYWQLEHQLLVSGAEFVLFVCSDGTPERFVSMEYCSDPERRAALIAGWDQFAADLTNYVPEPAKPAPVVAAPMESLPAVSVRVDGQLAIVSNLPAFGQALHAFIDKIPTSPSTDQEFADTEAACKALKNAEDALEAAESNALAQLADVDTMRRFVADYRALARTTRLQREKLVTLRKDEIRRDIVNQGMHALRQYIAELNAAMPADYMPTVPADFAGAIKGKRTVDSLRDAVDTELARAKIVASGTATRIHANVKAIRNSGLVVPDAATLVLKATDDLEAILAQRVAADKARIEAERERIRQEEERKAQVAAEAKAEAERARIRAEEQQKAQAESAERQAAEDRRRVEAHASLQQTETILAAHPVAVPGKPLAPATTIAAPVAVGIAPVAAVGSAADDAPELTLGAINERLHPISVSAAGLAEFGIEPLATKKAAKLYSQSQFEQLCRAIVRCATDALRGEMEVAERESGGMPQVSRAAKRRRLQRVVRPRGGIGSDRRYE